MAGRRTRRNPATSAQSTVRSDNPEQGMIVPVNGLETTLNSVANMMANIMERLDKALRGPSGTRDIPPGQPRQVLRTASSPILQELHDPEEVERERRAIDRRRVEELARNNKVNEGQAKDPSRIFGDGHKNPRGSVFERISRQKAHISERLGKNPEKAPQGWIRPQASQGFKMPFVKRYDGESDPQEHINSYVQVMIAVDASDALMCRCFFQTVDSKKHGESLKNFLIRWRKESREVEGTDDKSRLAMFTVALQDGLLHTDLTTHPPDTFEEAMVRAGRYVTLEERKEEKKEKTPKEEEKSGTKKPFKNKKQGFPDGPKGANPGTSEKHKPANPVFTLPVAEVMAHAAQQGLMTYPTYSLKVCNVKDTRKWCAYHRKNDHNTEDCYTLKNEMARLIRRGHLKKFVQDGDAGSPGNAQNGKRRDKEVAQAEAREKRHIGLEDEEEDSEPAPHRQKRHHECNFIIGGNTGGDSATSRKKWANAAMVNKVLVPEGKKLKTEPIVFSNADLPETGVPHRDALVITIDIMDLLIHKTLVDTGGSVNIMYMDTYKALGLTRDELSPIKTPLTGFTSDSIEPEGVITLPVEIGDTKATRKLDMEFVVVRIISSTNIILGRPGLEDLERVISPRNLCIKFPTPHGVGIARGSQRVSRAWYLKATKQPVKYDTQVGEVTAQLLRAEEKRPRVEVAGDIEEVELEPGTPGRFVRIAKVVQRLTGRLAALNRFLSKLAQKAHPFFAVIKKKATFEWTPECQEAFEELKRYLTSPQVLSKPEPGDILTLYLAIADCAMSTMIVRQERGAQHPVYYVSKTLRDAELSRSPEASARMTKWAVFISQYNVQFRPRPSIKGQALADFQVECTAREMTRAQVETRMEKDWWIMSIDGSSGSRSCRAGVVLITPEKFRIYYAIRFQFRVSNNEAEYEALINGEFEAKEERMKRYRDLSLEMLGRFEFKLEHIPRAQNAEADVLSKLSTESPEYISRLATVEELVTPSLSNNEVIWVSADPPEWLDRLAKYIEDGEAPENPQEARLLRMRAPTYKGYFWPTMRKDCEEYVRKCPTCQQFQNIPGKPATNYTPISSVIPFSRWGIDLVGALPKGAGQASWIVVAIDYFTKWVEAEPLAGITGRQMIDFGTNILCRFGVSKQIISDNGTQFEEAEFQDFLKTWGIQHTKVSVAYPQANGQVENVNRTIIDGIKKKLLSEGSKWVDELPRILWTNRTTLRRATGDTPFGLAYGFEARAPAEVVIPTRREMEYDPEVNEQNQAVELNFVEERRDEARIRAENYRRQVKSYFDSKVKPRAFQVGDYVLRKREKSQPTKGGKLGKKYEGPYVIKAVVRPGTYKLVTPKGKEIDRTWNVEHLVKFYQ
ncbi:unnamed protein product [Cuscuta campestris]|uniref:Integrase catalytic domain-containing protein n=1 Tax=Cuscuta campestris TaxID=132261 RepID=A0A484MBI8_9ASTE|nr:unnamed protein product [Cuscuta campestris]